MGTRGAPCSGRAPDAETLPRSPLSRPQARAHSAESALRRGRPRPGGAPPRPPLLFAVPLTFHFWFSCLPSALPPSVRQALSSVGSHLRVNIISDGHNRLE